ncbi:NAD(P)-dependent oxidoreductase [Aggregatilineales bacterium SYSU G02658]
MTTSSNVKISIPEAAQPVLVTGGTGFLGRAVVAALLAQGAAVRVAARRPDRLPPELRDAERFTADLATPNSFEPALEGVGAVIHTAVSYGSFERQQQVNVRGTQALARLAAERGVRRFVHISSLAVYGYRHSEIVTEETPPVPSRDPYSMTKRIAEKAVQATPNLNWVILRPGAIYGPYAPLWTSALFQLARRRPFLFIGDGRGRLPLVHVDDVVEAILRVLDDSAAVCEAFNLVHPEPVTWRDVLSAYAAAAGQTLRWRAVPTALAATVASVAALTSFSPSMRAALPELLYFLEHAPSFSTDKLQRTLGWQPQVSLTEGIRRTQFYLDHLIEPNT